MAGLFLKYHLRRIIRYFETRRFAKSITAGLFLLVFTGAAFGLYLFFEAGLRFIAREPYFLAAMSAFLYEVFFLIVIFLMLASSMITGIFSLFRRSEDGWIMASPCFQVMPLYIYSRIFVSSLWPLIIIVLPALFAIRSVFGIGLVGILMVLVSVSLLTSLVVFVVMIILMTAGRILQMVRFSSGRPALTIGGIVLAFVALLAAFSLIVWFWILPADLVELFGAAEVEQQLADVTGVVYNFRALPSHPVVLTLLAVQQSNPAAALPPLFLLIMFVAGAALIFSAVSYWYLPLWQLLQEGAFEARAAALEILPKPVRFPRFLKNPLGAVFEKEALITFRNIRNLLWVGFLLFLWLAQTALNLFVRRHMVEYGADSSVIAAGIEALQIVVTVYFASAFILRFAFPSFSAERRTAWIIGSAPFALSRLYWAKFLFYSAVFTVFGAAIGLLNAFILGIPVSAAGLFLVFIAVAIIFATALGLSLGAMFPNFETDNPQILSTSLPGLGFILGSLVYGGAGAVIFYKFLITGALSGLVLFELISLALIALLLYTGPRFLAHTEFVNIRE